MNRIASDEPDELTFAPKPIIFWHRGQRFEAGVSRTAFADPARFWKAYPGTGHWHLEGEFGRSWIADPCSMILQESLSQARWDENAQAKADRLARRQAKAKLLEEEAAARRGRAQRW